MGDNKAMYFYTVYLKSGEIVEVKGTNSARLNDYMEIYNDDVIVARFELWAILGFTMITKEEKRRTGCTHCAYFSKSRDEMPCAKCSHNFVDRFKDREEV